MATNAPAPTPEADAAIASAGAALAQGWRAALGVGGVGAAPPTPTPAPPPATPTAPALAPAAAPTDPIAAALAAAAGTPASPSAPAPGQVAAAPAHPTAALPTPGQPVTEITDPDAQYFLSLHGGDVQAALKAAKSFNNRLAALAKSNPDLFKAGAAGDPHLAATLPSEPFVDPLKPPQAAAGAPTAPAASPEGAAVELDWGQVKQTVEQRIQGDAECQKLIGVYRDNNVAIQEAKQAGTAEKQRFEYLTMLLKDPGAELSELRKEELADERRSLEFSLNLKRQDIMLRTITNRELDVAFREIEKAHINAAVETHQAAAYSQAAEAEAASLTTQEEHRTLTQWPSAVQAAMTAHGIPAAMLSDFSTYARRILQSEQARNPIYYVEDLVGYVHAVGYSYMKQLDTYHRAQASVYATAAAARAASPAPPPPPGTPPAPPATPAATAPEAIMVDIGRELAQRWRR